MAPAHDGGFPARCGEIKIWVLRTVGSPVGEARNFSNECRDFLVATSSFGSMPGTGYAV